MVPQVPLFIAGGPVRPGLIGDHPSLTDLDAGAISKMSIDFRRVYATLLTNWLRIDAAPVLKTGYQPMEFLKV